MCKVREGKWLLYALSGSGFFRFPLYQFGYELPMGIILVAENSSHTRKIERELVRAFKGAEIVKLNSRKEHTENFRMGVYRYKKGDKEDDLDRFLSEKDFLPIVIVGGVVPEKLCGKGYIFKASFDTEEITEVEHEYRQLRNFLIEKTDYICQEIRVLKTSNIVEKYKKKGISSFAYYMLAVARVWWCLKCENIKEAAADQWVSAFMESVIEAESDIERFSDFYSVKEAVRECVTQFIMKNDLPVVNIYNGMSTEKQVIYDEDFYFISESLLKSICTPLLNTVSFLQLKKEMEEDRMLITDKTPGGYTVKKLIFSAETGQTKRVRMLKLNKEDFVNSEGICLEDLQEFYKEREEN